MKKIITIIFLSSLLVVLVACSGKYNGGYLQDENYNYIFNDDEHQEIIENPFIDVSVNNKSNISLSANTASYSFIRSQINSGRAVDRNAVRIEEMVNFFNYNYNQPETDKTFGFKSELIQTPWNNGTHLLLIGLETKQVDLGDIPSNIVILLDVSGSMSATNKLSLAKKAMELLIEQMKPNDVISLVTYSSGEKVVFKGKSIDDMAYMTSQIRLLKASGATAGKKGLDMAYKVAEEYFIEGGNNRIILATDGDFNVGISSTDMLIEYISEKRESGIYFSAYGFGYGNFKDEKLERVAKAGNGTYHYIDDIISARKAFVDNIDGVLYTVARDAKAQIVFDASAVLEYRLIGYENRQLTDDEFDDGTTDAGEIGTGLQVTAIYELKLNEGASDVGSLTIRYKNHDITDDTQLEEAFTVLNAINENPSVDAKFISSVVEFGLILMDSKYKVDADLGAVLERIETETYNLEDYYRNDFIDVLNTYKDMTTS
jgi:Ca-activated chloride channel family protein